MVLKAPEVFIEVTGTVAITNDGWFFFLLLFLYTFPDILTAIFSNS